MTRGAWSRWVSMLRLVRRIGDSLCRPGQRRQHRLQRGRNQDGNDAASGQRGCLGSVARPPGAQILDGYLAVVDRAGKGDSAPHDQRLGQLKDDQGEAGAVQAGGDAGRQVAAAAQNHQKVTK